MQTAESKAKLETTDNAEQELNNAASVKIASIDMSEQKKAESENESATSTNTDNAAALSIPVADIKKTAADTSNSVS